MSRNKKLCRKAQLFIFLFIGRGCFRILFIRNGLDDVIQMAGAEMSRFDFLQCGINGFTDFHTFLAAGMEFATRRGVRGGGDAPFQNDPLHLEVGVGYGNCRKQRLCIGMQGICKHLFGGGEFHHAAQIHNTHRVRDMPTTERSWK